MRSISFRSCLSIGMLVTLLFPSLTIAGSNDDMKAFDDAVTELRAKGDIPEKALHIPSSFLIQHIDAPATWAHYDISAKSPKQISLSNSLIGALSKRLPSPPEVLPNGALYYHFSLEDELAKAPVPLLLYKKKYDALVFSPLYMGKGISPYMAVTFCQAPFIPSSEVTGLSSLDAQTSNLITTSNTPFAGDTYLPNVIEFLSGTGTFLGLPSREYTITHEYAGTLLKFMSIYTIVGDHLFCAELNTSAGDFSKAEPVFRAMVQSAALGQSAKSSSSTSSAASIQTPRKKKLTRAELLAERKAKRCAKMKCTSRSPQ